MDPETLIRGFLAGEESAVEQVRAWVERSIAGFRRRLGEDFEDAVQEILIELMRVFEAGTFAGTGALEAFISRIARRRAIDRLRRQRPERQVDLAQLSPWLDDPEALGRLRSVEAIPGLLRLWNAMPEACRKLWRFIAEGYGYREMGALLGVAPGTLRVRVKRCREKAFAHRETHGNSARDVTTSAAATTESKESPS